MGTFDWLNVIRFDQFLIMVTTQHNKLPSVMSLRIRRISAVMYEKLETSEEIKMKNAKEREMTTELLAGVGIAEPRMFKIKTGIIIKAFLLSCTVTKNTKESFITNFCRY